MWWVELALGFYNASCQTTSNYIIFISVPPIIYLPNPQHIWSEGQSMGAAAYLWMVAIHSANSRALGMVAERNTKRAVFGIMMMDSSHTTPRSLSLWHRIKQPGQTDNYLSPPTDSVIMMEICRAIADHNCTHAPSRGPLPPWQTRAMCSTVILHMTIHILHTLIFRNQA